MGIPRGELLGKSFWEVFPLTLGTSLEREYRRAAAGEVRDFENFYEPWGRWFHNRCFPREGGGMSAYFEDATERKRAEEERHRGRQLSEALNRINQALTTRRSTSPRSTSGSWPRARVSSAATGPRSRCGRETAGG